jgi:Ribbon-helix-helix protein, copG family.
VIKIRNKIITFRVTEEEKKELFHQAEKQSMGVSEFINRAIKESINLEHLTESQEQFAKTFEIIFKKIYEPYSKRDMVIMNRINFNEKWIIRILNLLLKHIQVPQEKDEVLTSFVDHPMLDIASEEVLKEIRNGKQKKVIIENEYE